MELALPLPIRGLVIGFTIAAAVGPITLLVVRRTIDHGGIYGFASGLGVATADATYGAPVVECVHVFHAVPPG